MAMRPGWRTPVIILVCATVVGLISFGVRASFGLFLTPITTDMGWGRETFAFAIALQNLFWGLSQPIAGAIADKYGSGRVVAVCAVVFTAGLYLMAQATTPAELSLTAGLLVGVGLSGTSFGILLAVIGRNVSEGRRSLFLGIGSAGGSAGQLLLVPLGQAFLDGYGWVTTITLFAALSLVMVPLAAALTGKRGAADMVRDDQTLRAALGEARRHRGYGEEGRPKLRREARGGPKWPKPPTRGCLRSVSRTCCTTWFSILS